MNVAKQLPLLGKIMLGTALATLPLVFFPPVEEAVFDTYEYNSVVERDGELRFYLKGRMVAPDDVPDTYFNKDVAPKVGDKVIFIRLKNHDQRVFIGRKHQNREPFEKYMEDINGVLRGDKRSLYFGGFVLSLMGCLASYPTVTRKIMSFISRYIAKIKW